jgi:hypothetical protein
VGVGLTMSVPVVKGSGASGTEKDSYVPKGVRGLKALRESFHSDKVRKVFLSCCCFNFHIRVESLLL